MIPFAEKFEMSLIFLETEMSSENPEMSIRLFDKISFFDNYKDKYANKKLDNNAK